MSTTLLIAQYRGRSLASKVIQWQTWSQISHSSLVQVPATFPLLCADDLRVLLAACPVIEAWKGSVRLHHGLSDGHTPATPVILYRVDGPLDATAAWDFAAQRIGAPYDYRGVLGFGSRRSRAHSDSRWFCSELVFAALAAGGCRLLSRINAYQVSPAKIDISPLLHPVCRTTT
jgi:hypothetical protein